MEKREVTFDEKTLYRYISTEISIRGTYLASHTSGSTSLIVAGGKEVTMDFEGGGTFLV